MARLRLRRTIRATGAIRRPRFSFPPALSPSAQTLMLNSRLCALLLLAGLVFVALGKFRTLERVIFPSQRAEHLGLLYLLSCLTFLSLPDRRRADLTLGLLGVALALGLLHAAVQHRFEIASVGAFILGPAVAYVPTLLEEFRARMRRHPYAPLFGPRHGRRAEITRSAPQVQVDT